MTWHSKDHDREKIADSIDLDTLKTYLKAGLMIDQLPGVHDTLFTRLITFQAYLQFNNIRHLIFDTGNAYKTNHILGLRDNQSKDYLPGLSKTNLVLKCPGIYNFFSFCSNIWMYENCVTDHKNYVPWNEDKPLPYPVSYTHLRAHETINHRVFRLLLEKGGRPAPCPVSYTHLTLPTSVIV